MHTFLYFVVSLQNRFYALALISVSDMNIYFSTLMLFKIDPGVSLTSNPSTIIHFIVAFAVTLASRYICFEYLDRVKRTIFQASDIVKRLSINVLVILWRYLWN